MAVFCLSTVVSTVLVLATVLDFQHSSSTVLPRYPNFFNKNKKTGELLQEVQEVEWLRVAHLFSYFFFIIERPLLILCKRTVRSC